MQAALLSPPPSRGVDSMVCPECDAEDATTSCPEKDQETSFDGELQMTHHSGPSPGTDRDSASLFDAEFGEISHDLMDGY